MSDNYCKCKGCKHIDPNERSGYKWYCTWYRSYEDPDYVHECAHFESQDGSGGCFLTSACCGYKGLPDDCPELTALRAFRDTHLMTCEAGRRLVEEYYRIAPPLVEKLETHPNKNGICEHIYSAVCSVIRRIEEHDFDAAVTEYEAMVRYVQTAVS